MCYAHLLFLALVLCCAISCFIMIGFFYCKHIWYRMDYLILCKSYKISHISSFSFEKRSGGRHFGTLYNWFCVLQLLLPVIFFYSVLWRCFELIFIYNKIDDSVPKWCSYLNIILAVCKWKDGLRLWMTASRIEIFYYKMFEFCSLELSISQLSLSSSIVDTDSIKKSLHFPVKG